MPMPTPNYILQTDTNKQELVKIARQSYAKLLKKKYSLQKAREKILEETGVVL